MIRRTLGIILILASSLVAFPSLQSGGQDPRPIDDEEREERLAHSRRILDENCLICHSAELITSQRLTPPQWKAEVTKMIGWGSPVPPEDVAELVDYLAATFGNDRPRAVAERVAPAELIEAFRQDAGPDAKAGEGTLGRSLFEAQCATCHGPTALGAALGNNLILNPILLRTGEFRETVRDGRRRMPGFRAVLDDEQVGQIRHWLMTLDAPRPAD